MGTPGPDPALHLDTVVEAMKERRDAALREPWTATEVADAFGVSRVTAYKRLDDLEEIGVVESKKVGSSARVYWLANEYWDVPRP